MSPAAAPLLSIPVGVVVERRKAASPWIDFVWRGIAVLPDEAEMQPWTIVHEEDGATLFYAGSAAINLYRSETARYRDNVATAAPCLWIILSASEGSFPYAIAAVTADPAEAEAFTEAGANLVEAVPMSQALRDRIEIFIAQHHVERQFVKRKQDRADPEALARRQHDGGRK